MIAQTRQMRAVTAMGTLAAAALMLTACVYHSYVDVQGRVADEHGLPYERCRVDVLHNKAMIASEAFENSSFNRRIRSGVVGIRVTFEVTCDGAAERYRSKPINLHGRTDVGTFVLKRAPQ